MRYVADTYAWIAYFNRKRFQGIIEGEVIETPSVVIAELARTLKRKKIDEKTTEKLMQFIVARGIILPLDFDGAKAGADAAEREGLSLVDGIIYSYAQSEDCSLITGDEHFKGKKNVVFEKE